LEVLNELTADVAPQTAGPLFLNVPPVVAAGDVEARCISTAGELRYYSMYYYI
jgi:hypothetical protein